MRKVLTVFYSAIIYILDSIANVLKAIYTFNYRSYFKNIKLFAIEQYNELLKITLKDVKAYFQTIPVRLLSIFILIKNLIVSIKKKDLLQFFKYLKQIGVLSYDKLQIYFRTFTWKKARRLLLKSFVFGIISCILFIFGLIFFVKQGWLGHLPSKEELANINNHEASLVYSSDNVLIGKYYTENRSAVDMDDIPEHIIDALISTEDVRFLEHDGVDLRSLLRVLVKSILLRQDNSGGGSTISQQLIKNLFGRHNYGFLTMPIVKVKEMLIASKLEEVYTKNQILAMYLNTVSFGENVYGIENAAMRYFSKNCNELTIEEGAVLIGMLKANTFYNPHLNPKNSLKRRNTVLALMQKNGKLRKRQCDSLQKIELKLKYKSALEYQRENGYFLAYVQTEADSIVARYNRKYQTKYNLLTDGLKIETTLDKRMQNILLTANEKHILQLQKELKSQLEAKQFWKKNAKKFIDAYKQSHNGLSQNPKATLVPYGLDDSIMNLNSIDSLKYFLSALQSAVLASDPTSGAIRVWIGGSNYQFFPYNRVLSRRQVGSTFKPIVYYTAMAKGLDPCKYLKNEKKVYKRYDDWSPGNSGDFYEGYYSVRGGLANSVNTIAAQVLFHAGIKNSIKTARKLGIKAKIPEVPSIVLGVADISLYEMVQAYSSFANGGYKTYLYTIEKISAKDGTVLYEKIQHKRPQILSPDINDQLVDMLSDVVNEGTAKRIRETYRISDDIGGKTGTTQNNTDGWFIGFTPNLVMGVWVGADNPSIHFQNTKTGQGANTALPIWAMGYKKITAYQWGKKYKGEFDLDLGMSMDCETWREDPETLFEKIFGRRDTVNSDSSRIYSNPRPSYKRTYKKPNQTYRRPPQRKTYKRKETIGDVIKDALNKKKRRKRRRY